jgi:hypothetical protein
MLNAVNLNGIILTLYSELDILSVVIIAIKMLSVVILGDFRSNIILPFIMLPVVILIVVLIDSFYCYAER